LIFLAPSRARSAEKGSPAPIGVRLRNSEAANSVLPRTTTSRTIDLGPFSTTKISANSSRFVVKHRRDSTCADL
jgi:hypothetical protein